MKDKLGLDLDQIIKIIKASKTNSNQCKGEKEPVKQNKSSKLGKSSGGSIRMNRGMRISGRAGKPVLETGLGVSLGNPNVIRQSADTVLQQDTAKLSNELIKYQLELAKKQQADYEQYQTPIQRFKSNKFLNDDDEYGISKRFSNYALPRSISLGMMYETSNRLDNLESNYFKPKGNSKFDATDGQFSNTDGTDEDNRVELIDNDMLGSAPTRDGRAGVLPNDMLGSAPNDSYALPVPNNLSSSLSAVSSNTLPENDVDEDLNLNSSFTSPLPKNDVEEKIKDKKSMLSRIVDNFPRFIPGGGAKVHGFVNDYPEPKSGFAGDNPMIAQDVLPNNMLGSAPTRDDQTGVLPPEPEPDFGIPSNVKAKKKATLNPIKDTNTDKSIPTEEKSENLIKQKRRVDAERDTDFQLKFMLRRIRAYNKTIPFADRYKGLENLRVRQVEDIYKEIYG